MGMSKVYILAHQTTCTVLKNKKTKLVVLETYRFNA